MATRCGYITAYRGGTPRYGCMNTTDDRYCPGHAEMVAAQGEDRQQEWREAAESDRAAERGAA